ncbi:MAG: T9SS type A sorting domain-containing protein [Algibacter sp.]
MKKLFYLSAFALSLGLVNSVSAQTFATHDFNDGNLDPFEIGKSDQSSRVQVVSNSVKTTWDEDDYNGSNSDRKSQFNPIDEVKFTQEFWAGFELKVDSNYMATNTNTEAGLMQIWGFNPDGTGNHIAMLKFDGNNGGELTWQHRYNSSSSEQDYLVYSNFPRNTYKKIVIRVKLAQYNKGTVQIWVDDVLKLSKTNQTIGWGTQTSSGQTSGYYSSGAAFGQYNFLENAATAQTYYSSSHSFDGHLSGEQRTVYYDDVTVYVGENGYEVVDPDNDNNLVHMRKRNSTGFAIDGGHGGANNNDVKLWAQDATNVNQQWIEIDRGSGYYSYQKNGTNFCIDGGHNGGNLQNVKLYKCSDSEQNQHWSKISAGSGHYRLQKRNSSGYSIDGNHGGANGNSLYLYGNSTNNYNQQWLFNDIDMSVTSKKSAQKVDTEQLEDNLDAFSVYPNPVENALTIEFNDNYDQETSITLYNVNAQKVIETKPNGEEVRLDLSKLNSGIYVLKINSKTQNLTKKIVKI